MRAQRVSSGYTEMATSRVTTAVSGGTPHLELGAIIKGGATIWCSGCESVLVCLRAGERIKGSCIGSTVVGAGGHQQQLSRYHSE